jgi:hypothetical protein
MAALCMTSIADTQDGNDAFDVVGQDVEAHFGADPLQRAGQRNVWLIDFPLDLSEREAALFQAPFERLKASGYAPDRDTPEVPLSEYRVNTPGQNKYWWQPHRPRPKMRKLLDGLSRYIITRRISKHRIFAWAPKDVVPDSATVAIARNDDVRFGILHSRFHEVWSLKLGIELMDGQQIFRLMRR